MTVLDAFNLKHIIWWEDRGHVRLASPLNPALISSVLVCFTVSFLSRRERLNASGLSICLSVCLSVSHQIAILDFDAKMQKCDFLEN